MKLNLSPDLRLPVDAATQTLLVVGKRGSGKSTTAVRFAEQLIQAQVPVAVIDPVDVWWGLKAGADGNRAGGLEVYVFGGRHADLPLEPTAGAVMADVLVDDRINAVMVIRTFSNREKAMFMSVLAERLFQRNQDALHLICEEAHEVMPQNPFKGEEEMLGRMARLSKLGRSSGIGMTSVTQRPASLNKNITTQAEILVAHRLIGPQDVKAIEEWIKHHRVEELKQQVLSTLGELKTGNAWVWAPDFPEDHPIGLKRVHMAMPETFDSRRTPKPGESRREPRQLAAVDLEKLKTRMAATIERAKATDPRELQREVVRLKAELAKKPQVVSTPVVKEQRIEVPVLKDAQITRLESLADRFLKAADSVSAGARELAAAVAKAHRNGHGPMPVVLHRQPEPRTAGRSVLGAGVRREAATAPISPGDVALKAGARRILQVMAERHPVTLTVSQVRTLAGLRKSGTSDAYLSLLKRERLIDDQGGVLTLTDRGLAAAPPVMTPADPIEAWRSKLKAGARQMLDVAIRNPQGITKEQLLEQTGLVKSGTSDAYFGILKRNGLIDHINGLVYPGAILEVSA